MSNIDEEREAAEISVSPWATFLRILIFAALVAGTALLLRPLQLIVFDRMEKARDSFIGLAEDYLGVKLKYGSMGPSVFGVLDIRNVLVLREDDSALLSVSRLRLSYSIFDIIKADSPVNILHAFRSIRIDRPVLSLDFERDAALIERISALRRQGAPPVPSDQTDSPEVLRIGDLLNENFSFRILDGSWDVTGSPGSVKLSGLRLDALIRENRVSFQGRWDIAASLKKTSSFLPTPEDSPAAVFEASLSGRISGEYLDDLEEGSATVQIPSFSGSYFRSRPLALGIFLSHGNLEIRKSYDRMPVAISLVYDAVEGRFIGLFEAENFSPSELVTFTGPWKDYNSLLGIKLYGNAGFDLDRSGAIGYAVNLEGKTDGRENRLASLSFSAEGDSEHINVNTLKFASNNGELLFNGNIIFLPGELIPLAPDGNLSFSNLNLRMSGDLPENRGISGDIKINTQGRMINLFGENISAGKSAIKTLDASLYQDEQGLSFIFTAQKKENEEGNTGKLSLEGSVDYNPGLLQPFHTRASLLLDSFLLGDILAFTEPLGLVMPLPPLARPGMDNFSISTEVFFTTDYEHLLYNAPNVSVSHEGMGNFLAEASFSGTNRNFELSTGRISWKDGFVDVSCSVDYSDTNDISFSIGAVYRDLSYFFEGMILDKKNVNVRGSYGFQVNLSYGSSGAYSGYALGELLPIPSGDSFASLSFLITLFYDSPSYWQAKIEKFEITGITTPATTSAYFRFTGDAGEKGMSIPELVIDDGRGILEGGMDITWDASFSYCRFVAELFGSSRNEYYGLNGLFRDNRLELYFSCQGMQLSRISSQNAVLDGNIRLSWDSPVSFDAEANISSLIIYLNEEVLMASASCIANSEVFRVKQLSINYSGLQAQVPNFTIDRIESRAEAEALMLGSFSGVQMDISLRLNALFGSSETWLDLIADYGFMDASVTVDTARYDTIEAEEPFSFSVNLIREKKGSSVNVAGGPRNMLRLNYSPGTEEGGLFFAALSAPSPVRGSFTGTINAQAIDAQLTDLYVDLGALWRFIPPSVDVVMFPGGFVTGSIRVMGSLEEPEFYGTAQGRSIQILVPQFLPEPIRPVPTVFLLNGSEMTFGPIDAAVGRGGGRASGWFRFEQWIPSTFIIDIQVPQETPIPYGFDLSGLLAHGLASGRLIVAMEEWILSITGDLIAHNTEISLNTNEMAVFSSDMLLKHDSIVTTVTDFSIRSGKRVEFFWPSVEFPILRANADMGTGINVNSDTGDGSFSVTGDVKLRSGEIFYLERNFYLREGVLFLNESELEFDPRISARAEIRDQAEDGPVTIAMIIENAPLMYFTPRFESNPALSQFEIFSILGQNPQGDLDSGQRNVFLSGIDFLAQSILFRRFQRQVRDLLGVDMFSMRTTVFQNLILQVPGNSSQENAERPARFGNYFDNSTVFIGKFFGADIFGEALLSFKYDEAQQTFGGMKLEPELGLEMRNPLFDIRLGVAPQGMYGMLPRFHPENMFINDISFSLVWRRTF